jgi:hypothetical protein
VAGRGVLRRDRSLHSSLGHHRVGISDAELGADNRLSSVLHGD